MHLKKKVLGRPLLRANAGGLLESLADLIVIDDGPQKTKDQLEVSGMDILRTDVHQPFVRSCNQ